MGDEKRRGRIIEIYSGTTEIFHTVRALKELDDEYLDRSWSVALSNVTYDVKGIICTMEEMGLSFDYKQASVFMSYCKIFEYLLKKMADELLSAEEGKESLKFIINNLNTAFDPFGAYVCTRVRDTGVINSLPEKMKSMYRYYEDDMDSLASNNVSEIFNMALTDEEDFEDDEYLESFMGDVEKMFGDSVDVEDFTKISTILAEYSRSNAEDNLIELDF